MHSFTDDLHEDPLLPFAVKLSVSDLLPRPEVQLSIGDGGHNLPTHGLTFQTGIAVILTGSVMPVLRNRLVGGERSYSPPVPCRRCTIPYFSGHPADPIGKRGSIKERETCPGRASYRGVSSSS